MSAHALAPANDPRGDGTDFVRFTDVEKTYDGLSIVVQRLTLSVRRGEFLTMLGPSGSGKTTTLMMLAGFEMPTAGTIHLDGKPIERLPPHQRDIGVVFQNYALFPHMTIEETSAFPCACAVWRAGKCGSAWIARLRWCR